MTRRPAQGRQTYRRRTLFKVSNFNVAVLATKLVSAVFTRFLTSFDLICFTETFVDGAFEMKVLKDYQPCIASAKKLSRQGSQSEGSYGSAAKGLCSVFQAR